MQSRRFPVLDGARAISILLVMAGHMVPLPGALSYTSGAMGMSLFFSLSGFLITNQLMSDLTLRAFFIRRIARIVPLILAYAVVAGIILHVSGADFLRTIFFFVNYTDAVSGYNGHLWSVCVELHFYIAIGLAVWLLGQRALWLVFPACILVTVLRIQSGNTYPYETHLRVDEILIGGCIALAFQRPKELRYAELTLCLGVVLWFAASHPATGFVQYARAYATGLVFFSLLHLRKSWFTALLGSWPLANIAKISYALYVIHPITIHGWMNEGNDAIRIGKRAVSLVISASLAALSWRYFEDPINKWAHEITAPMKPRRRQMACFRQS